METAGGALVPRGAWHGIGPVGSVREAMNRALLLPGVLAVALGELARVRPLAWAHGPQLTERLALDASRRCVILAASLCQEGEEVDEILLTGPRSVSLLQTQPLPAGGRAYMHVSLSREEANVALCSLGLRALVDDLPRLLTLEPQPFRRHTRPEPPPPPPAPPPAPALPRRAAVRGAGRALRAQGAPSTSLLQTVLDRLRQL